MTISRAFYNILTSDLEAAERFYVDFVGMKLAFKSDWFVHVSAPDHGGMELGLIRRDHEIVPSEFRGNPGGGIYSIVVDDVDKAHERAKEFDVEVIEAPRDLFYGQRRMLVKDPDGTLLDISQPCDPDPDWVKRVKTDDGGHFVEEPS